MFFSFWNYLTSPSLPGTALAITPSYLALVELSKRGGALTAQKVGVQDLPEGIIQASVTEPNILNEGAFIDQLRTIADKAGFSKKLSLSVSLPEGSVKSIVVTLENEPKTRDELKQMLEWKAVRSFNLKQGEARLKHHRISGADGTKRYFVSAVGEAVAAQYERVFKDIGWQAGAIMPQHLGEAQWLLRSEVDETEDQALVSVHNSGFVALILRNQEPLLVREVSCSSEECEDELFRFMTFYRDRLSGTNKIRNLLLVAESPVQANLSKAVTAALEYTPHKLSPGAVGLNLDSNAPFLHLAAASGLASMAY